MVLTQDICNQERQHTPAWTLGFLGVVCLFVLFWGGFKTGFLCSLEPVLELALVDQAGLKLTEIFLPLPP